MHARAATPPLPDPAARAERNHRGLARLLELGLQVAESVAASAQPGDAPLTPADAATVATAFDRVATAIRRTILLDTRLDDLVANSETKRTNARRRIIRAVEDAIERHETGPSNKESLRAELAERLDGSDLLDDVESRPTEEIIADICRDLGLENYPGLRAYCRRTPDDIAALTARAAAPPRQADPTMNAILDFIPRTPPP